MKINEVFEKLIENPKDVYQCFLRNRSELSVSDLGFFQLRTFDKNNRVLDPHSGAGGFTGNLTVNTNWQLVRQPVDFMLAINSGKNIRPITDTACDFREARYWLAVTMLTLEMVNEKWEVE